MKKRGDTEYMYWKKINRRYKCKPNIIFLAARRPNMKEHDHIYTKE